MRRPPQKRAVFLGPAVSIPSVSFLAGQVKFHKALSDPTHLNLHLLSPRPLCICAIRNCLRQAFIAYAFIAYAWLGDRYSRPHFGRIWVDHVQPYIATLALPFVLDIPGIVFGFAAIVGSFMIQSAQKST